MNKKANLLFTLQEGEGYRIEFKEKISDLDREIVALANGSGGSIFLGVSDDGHIKGIEITNQLKSQIVDIARNCDPNIVIELNSYQQEKVLEIQVCEGNDKPYRCKDGFFLRIGPSSQKLKRDEIVNLINHSGKIQFDQTLNHHFDYENDFSTELLSEFLDYCGIRTKLSSSDILINLGIVKKEKDKLVFTQAGILFFAKNPQKFLPESYITAVKYSSPDRFSIIDKHDIKGNLIQQIEHTMNFIVRNISVAADIHLRSERSLTRRQNIYDYPLPALREAIINAVTHRDYFYDSSHIYVHLYPDHIDIENPGGLYHGLKLEDLGRRSIRRNKLIADLLHHAHYIERVGSGFDRMKQSLQQNNNPPLEVNATNFFDVRFYKRILDVSVSELTSRQINLYYLFQERIKLTKKDVTLVLNVSDDTALRELNELLKLNLIKKVGTGKAIQYIFNQINK
ncbi:MAG: RNA-binding domain-containing protein [Gammaproteobacteria bacterium]